MRTSETSGSSCRRPGIDHEREADHDLVYELSRRLDALWRYDLFVANADGHPKVQLFWREFKRQEVENIGRLKRLLKQVIGHC